MREIDPEKKVKKKIMHIWKFRIKMTFENQGNMVLE
jgi:hypothetical protein